MQILLKTLHVTLQTLHSKFWNVTCAFYTVYCKLHTVVTYWRGEKVLSIFYQYIMTGKWIYLYYFELILPIKKKHLRNSVQWRRSSHYCTAAYYEIYMNFIIAIHATMEEISLLFEGPIQIHILLVKIFIFELQRRSWTFLWECIIDI